MRVIDPFGRQRMVRSGQSSKILTTKGDLLVYGSDYMRLPVGTNGDFLTVDSGETSGLKWGASPADIVHLGTVTASASSTVSFNGLTGYFAYLFTLAHVAPATDGTNLWVRTSTNNGSSYDSGASDYDYQYIFANSTTISAARATATTGHLVSATQGSAANETGSGHLWLLNPSVAQYAKLQSYYSQSHTDGNITLFTSVGRRLTAADVDAIQFFYTSGNIASGEFNAYGLKAA